MNRKTKTVFVCALSVMILAFIWSRSLQSAADSMAESKAVGAFFTPLLELFVGKGNVSVQLVRKLAHFFEFAVLGFLGVQLMIVIKRVKPFWIGFVGLCCICAAVIDEGLQLISDKRASQISDVLLDSAGAVFGILIALILFFCFYKKRKKRQGRTE